MPRCRRLQLATLALVLVFAVSACGGTPPAQPPAAGSTVAPAADATSAPAAAESTVAPAADTSNATGGVLTVGRTAAPDSLNPGVAYLLEAYDLFDLVYDTLIGIDARGKTLPRLATEWSVAADNKTWTFKLHDGVKWHDGQPLTSEDVKFTFEQINSYESFSTINSYTTRIASIEAPDPTTVVLTFEVPIANTDERFGGVYILPKHIWEKYKTTDEMTAFENTEMIGSGPFQMSEYKPGEFSRLKAVKDHYLAPPKIDEVIFKVYGNGDALIQALKTGEVDLINVPTNTAVRTLQSEANIKVEIGKARDLSDIIFNVIDPKNCPAEVGKCTGHPALQDVKVRQALAHATDKQALIDTILLGLGDPGLSLVPSAIVDGYASDLQDYTFDVEKSKQMLEEAGYKDTDGDGIREMPNDPSKPLRLRYSYPADQQSDGQRFYELLKDMWMQVGVELQLQSMEADALTAVCCPAFDFDVIRWGWSSGVDASGLLYIATTEQIPTGTSETGYSNPEFDALQLEQEATVDKTKRQELLHKMQEILLRDVPYIIPYYAQNVDAYRSDRFTGWDVDPEGILYLAGRASLTTITPVQ